MERQVARSLDTPASLLPVLSQLFAGMPSLGGMPGVVVRMLREAGIGRGHRVLDLACGKGPVAIAVAERLGCRVVAVDGYEHFLAEGARLAHRRGVSQFVRWVAADVGDLPRSLAGRRFDATVMLGLHPLPDAARVLRTMTVPSGVYVLDDCVLNPRARRIPSALADTPTLDECRGEISALGDAVEAAHLPTPSTIRRLNERLYSRLSRNARDIARQRPSLRGEIREFLSHKRHAHSLLQGPLRPCTWVIRRGE
jgi:ubiquinone/menaquinone biosynthesis C-methylase UbiE